MEDCLISNEKFDVLFNVFLLEMDTADFTFLV